MDSNLKWLVLAEIIILLVAFLVKYILKKLEEKKVNGILEYIEKKSKEKEINDKFRECIEIIKQNNVEK